MSFRIGDLTFGPTFQTLENLSELEELGFTRVAEVVDAEGSDELPKGVREEALAMAERELEMSYDARWVLHRLAGLKPPIPSKEG